MQWLILPILAFAGGCIFYQDIKTRAVTWILFPAIGMIGIAYSFFNGQSFSEIIKCSLINSIFLSLQFLLLKAVHFIKNGSGQLIGQGIGMGDIFFLVSCTFFFSPGNFIIFYCLSLVFTLINYLIIRSVKNEKKFNTIPMAGFQALFLSIYVFLNKLANVNLSNDTWIIDYLSNK